MFIYTSVTIERVIDAIECSHQLLDNPGFCVRCSGGADGVEPDAVRYECEACGEPGVFGAEELLIMMAA